MASGRTRLLPADWAPGGHQRPEELPRPSRVSLERVSSYDPKAAEPHRRNGGWRHPPPSGSPSGPVGPSGRNSNPDFPVQPRRPLGAKRNLEGGRGRVKAMFPLARRVCPAQDDRITAMEFPVMSRASGQARPGAHRLTGTATGAMAHLFAAWSQGAAQPAPTRTPVPARAFPAGEPCHRSWNRTLVPSSGEDLRPWWPTARYLPRSNADLVPSAEKSMAQAPSPAPHLHPSGVAAGHEPLTGRALGVP